MKNDTKIYQIKHTYPHSINQVFEYMNFRIPFKINFFRMFLIPFHNPRITITPCITFGHIS